MWIDLTNPDAETCANTTCSGVLAWGDAGHSAMNFNGYVTGGMEFGADDECAVIEAHGKLHGGVACNAPKSFLCMSECTARPNCVAPEPPAPAGMLRRWNDRVQTSGNVVR